MFVYGDVVYAQTWQVLTLKNCMEPFSYASAAYVVASALVSVRLFCKNLGKRAKIFWANGLPPPPPWQKIARTPMLAPPKLHHSDNSHSRNSARAKFSQTEISLAMETVCKDRIVVYMVHV